MSKIKSLNDIESITVHWSESKVINDKLGHDENYDIERQVDVVELAELLTLAEMEITGGYDKTSLTIRLNSGCLWCRESKFYICDGDTDLLTFLNKGQ